MKTYMAKGETLERKWYVVDATDMVLGRLSTQVAAILRGKHKPIFTPHVDTGDHVIIVNAEKVVLTGKKLDKKVYYTHSEFPGSLREITYRELLSKKPEFAVYESIRRMMPKGPLGRKMLKKLRIYRGPNHEQAAQMPETLVLK
jgi:large subunit ribosomal protein L13